MLGNKLASHTAQKGTWNGYKGKKPSVATSNFAEMQVLTSSIFNQSIVMLFSH